MRRRVLAVLVVSAPVAGLAGPPAPVRGPVTVMVISAAPIAKSAAEMDAGKRKAESIDVDLERLKKDWEAKNGKKHNQWPADRQAAYAAAVEDVKMATTDYLCSNTPSKDVGDTVDDIRRHLAGKTGRDWVTPVEDPTAAALVIQVMGRIGAQPGTIGDKHVCINFVPGGKWSAEAMGKASASWERELVQPNATLVHHFRTDAPFIRIETIHTDRWSDAADEAAYAVVKYIRANYDAIKP